MIFFFCSFFINGWKFMHSWISDRNGNGNLTSRRCTRLANKDRVTTKYGRRLNARLTATTTTKTIELQQKCPLNVQRHTSHKSIQANCRNCVLNVCSALLTIQTHIPIAPFYKYFVVDRNCNCNCNFLVTIYLHNIFDDYISF